MRDGTGRIALHHHVCGHGRGDDAPRLHHASLTEGDVRQDNDSRSHVCFVFDDDCVDASALKVFGSGFTPVSNDYHAHAYRDVISDLKQPGMRCFQQGTSANENALPNRDTPRPVERHANTFATWRIQRYYL